ncbi:unnamed protein product [Pleuronectes platessa]|uniref:Uncharacterized protein n=1 Tax=Pleuronectes platessa TaxID=8262 RepID=A0A9N7UCK7_PLEPL|nr:unnamed protein product [Pleuronectes platessa]
MEYERRLGRVPTLSRPSSDLSSGAVRCEGEARSVLRELAGPRGSCSNTAYLTPPTGSRGRSGGEEGPQAPPHREDCVGLSNPSQTRLFAGLGWGGGGGGVTLMVVPENPSAGEIPASAADDKFFHQLSHSHQLLQHRDGRLEHNAPQQQDAVITAVESRGEGPRPAQRRLLFHCPAPHHPAIERYNVYNEIALCWGSRGTDTNHYKDSTEASLDAWASACLQLKGGETTISWVAVAQVGERVFH